MNPKVVLAALLLLAAGAGYGAGGFVARRNIAPRIVEVEKRVEIPVEKKVSVPVEVIKEVVRPCPVCTASAKNEDAGDERKPVATVSALDLFAAYSTNGISADKKYKGKRLKITGEVLRVGKDVLDSPFLVLKAHESNEFAGVQCTFPKQRADSLGSIRAGQAVEVVGTCDGYLLGSVGLQECRLHK